MRTRHFERNADGRSFFPNLILALLALACLATPPAISAQTAGTGALAGVVTDPSGAAVPGAQVKVTSEASGEARVVTTGPNGNYTVPLLEPGLYDVEVSKSGFRTVTVSKARITVTETAALNIHLEVGQVSQTVMVESQVEQLQTETSSLGQVTNGEQVTELPLSVRNFTQIIGLNPGVSSEVTNAGELGRGGGGNNQDPTVSNGNWASDNNFQMNGVGVNDIQQSGFFSAGVAIPNPDTIQEFKVQTGQYDASYGRNAGANVDVITKGGTNAYHGTIFEFFRNDALNANTFFLNAAGAPRAVLKQNQFGGTFGGPIKKDKLQFFTSYQGTRQRNGLDVNCSSTVTSAPFTNDRSAAALGALFAGQTGVFGGTAIAANGSNINPVALALMQTKLKNGQYLIPTPQKILTGAGIPFDAEGFSAFSEACPFSEDQFMTNADYEQSSKSRFSARFFFANSGITYTLPVTNLTGGSSPPGFPVNLTQNFRNFSLTHDYIFSSNLLNQAEIGFHRIYATFVQSEAFNYSSVGVSVVPPDNAVPAIAIDYPSTTGMQLGGNQQNVELGENTYTFQDSVSWTHGKHSVRFGGGVAREQNNQVGFHYLAGELFLSWPDFLLGLPGTPVSAGGNGSGIGNMFGSLDFIALPDRAYRDWDPWSYAQDDVKVTNRLTLNLGLRFERIGDFGDALGRNAGFDYTRADKNPPKAGTLDGTTVPSNYHGPLPAGVTKLGNDWGMNGIGQNTWNPRLGFAWQIPGTDRVVLRGGYGMYHTRDTGQPFLQLITAPPFGIFREFVGPSAATFSEAQPLPLTQPALPSFVPYSPATSNSITTFDPYYRPPTTHEYSLGTQTQLTPTMALEIGYSGARGLHLINLRSINQADLATPTNPIRGVTDNTLANLPLRVPFEGFAPSTMTQIEASGSSWYNALLVALNKRFSHGLQFQASYTYARDLSTLYQSTIGPNGGVVYGNQNDPHSRYGPDYFIRPHRFVVNYIYQLPKPAASGWKQQVLGGWSLVGVTTVQTGHLLTVTYTNTASAYGITTDRASLTGNCTKSQLLTTGSLDTRLTDWINKSCFTAPPVIGAPEPPGTCLTPLPSGACPALATGFGDSGVGILSGPGQFNFDFSVIKNFPVKWPSDQGNIQFRSEFFNIFNHPQFGDPDSGQNDPSFGQITTTVVNPRIIQFALKFSF